MYSHYSDNNKSQGSVATHLRCGRLASLQNIGLFAGERIFTRSPAVAEGPREHAVSWNLEKNCTNVRRIALEKACNRRMTFKVTNTGAVRYATYNFLLVFHWKYVPMLYRFRDINTYLAKI